MKKKIKMERKTREGGRNKDTEKRINEERKIGEGRVGEMIMPTFRLLTG
jgi:hypothetical protein